MTGVKPAMTLADSMGTDWPRVALLMLCGVFVATQVGKLPPAMPGLREHFGASLVQLGWISSVFNLVAALVALATGLVADRVGLRTMLKLGLLALGMGALLGASSGGKRISWTVERSSQAPSRPTKNRGPTVLTR